MAQRFSRAAAVAIVATAVWFVYAADASAQGYAAQGYGAPGWASPEPNYYAMPAGSDGLTAALYPCPRPTPPLVGQTYITYEPLAPHELLYLHHQRYVTDHCDGQVTRTTIHYGHCLSLHPTLTGSAPALHTPVHVCKF